MLIQSEQQRLNVLIDNANRQIVKNFPKQIASWLRSIPVPISEPTGYKLLLKDKEWDRINNAVQHLAKMIRKDPTEDIRVEISNENTGKTFFVMGINLCSWTVWQSFYPYCLAVARNQFKGIYTTHDHQVSFFDFCPEAKKFEHLEYRQEFSKEVAKRWGSKHASTESEYFIN